MDATTKGRLSKWLTKTFKQKIDTFALQSKTIDDIVVASLNFDGTPTRVHILSD